jgi:CRISPR/Cas system-associated endoribonuclease Cas2
MKLDEPTMKVVLDGIERHVNKEEDSVIIYELDAEDWEKKILLGLQTKERDFYEKEYKILG